MNPWKVEESEIVLRRCGKTAEECGELIQILGRIVIQGLDGVDPDKAKINRLALCEEIADVYAQLDVTIATLRLNGALIEDRRAGKVEQMGLWEELLREESDD